MPTAKTQPQAPIFPGDDFSAKAMDAVSAIAEANHRVAGQLFELGSAAMADRIRTLGELQSAVAEATRSALAPVNPRETFEEFRHDPLAWWRKGVLSAVDGSQRMVKLLETNAQIVARGTERLQGTAERTAKEIQDTVGACATRLRELYAAN